MYNIKVYERDGTTLKDTLQIEKLVNISTFPAQVNGGFGNLSFSLAYKITDTSIEISDIVKVQYKDKIIFTGGVLNVKKNYLADREVIDVSLIGYASLTSLLFTNATYTDIASNIIKDLIDDFNTEYGYNILSYDALSIPDSVGSISLDFSKYVSYFTAMTEVADTSGLFFFIDLDGKVYFDAKANFTSHTLTVGKDVDSITIDEDGKELVNSLILKYNGGTKVYNDAGSQTTYGKREKYLDKSSELSNVGTADIYGANYLTLFKDKIRRVSIQLNNEIDFFNIKGGDLINLRNIGYTINDLQVVKITYGVEKATIELERSYSFAKEIFIS